MQSIVVNMPFALTDIQASDYNSMITFWAFAYEWHVSLQMTPCSNQNGQHNTAALQLATHLQQCTLPMTVQSGQALHTDGE